MMNMEETLQLNRHREYLQISPAESASADDRRLVTQAKSGNPAAFGQLYECHQPRAYRSAYRILRDRADAEDAVQKAFQRAFISLAGFREDSAFSTWVTRIAINEALMMLRHKRRRAPNCETILDDGQSPLAFDPPDERPTPEQAAVADERRTAVLQAISSLRKSLRSVVLLRELQGLTSAETARRLGLTVSAVKARIFHARRHLRRHLERRYKNPRGRMLLQTGN